ncbi:hypothetical protein HaLaN_23035, partial [Haematococcus lacustris]
MEALVRDKGADFIQRMGSMYMLSDAICAHASMSALCALKARRAEQTTVLRTQPAPCEVLWHGFAPCALPSASPFAPSHAVCADTVSRSIASYKGEPAPLLLGPSIAGAQHPDAAARRSST